MRVLLKSKLYQVEIQRWITIVALSFWAVVATAFAIQNRRETLLIGINDAGVARLIEAHNDKFKQEELKGFLREFLSYYYTYDSSMFESRVGLAADLMSSQLWSEQKESLYALSTRFSKESLAQRSNIESLELLGEDRIEAVLKAEITQRLVSRTVRIKVSLRVKPHVRTQANPWGYEIAELSDATL